MSFQLENEKAARMSAEENAATLVRQRELDEKKMRELEAIREQLEELLGEERQAKKDEEIVRTLQVTTGLRVARWPFNSREKELSALFCDDNFVNTISKIQNERKKSCKLLLILHSFF